MGNVLNRKLFRHKAQIKHKKVPKHFLGGLQSIGALGLPYLTGLGAGAMRSGFGRAVAPVASRIKSGASNVAGQISQRTPNILKDNRLYRIGKKGIGAAELAYPVGMAGSGTVNFMRGDYEQALEDFGYAGIAYPFMAQGAQMVKPGGRLAKEAIRLTPRTIRRNPFKSALGIGALTMAPGMLFAEDQQDQISKIDANPDLTREQKNSEKAKILGRPLTASELGLEVPFLDDDVNQTDIVSAVDEANKVTDEKINKTMQVNNQVNQDIQDDKQPIVNVNQEGNLEVVDKEDPALYKEVKSGGRGPVAKEDQDIADARYSSYNAKGMITDGANPTGNVNNANTSDLIGALNAGDLSVLLTQTKIDFQKASDAVANYESKIEARDKEKRKTFEQYKKMYQDMTGDTGNNYRNYALLKWASRMMSGKTSQTGFSGFMDVLGQSTESLAQDMMAIDMHEKATSTALANSYMSFIQNLDKEYNKGMKDVFTQNIGIINSELQTEAKTKDEQLRRASSIYVARIKAQNALDVANAKATADRFKNQYNVGDKPELRVVSNEYIKANPQLGIQPTWSGESLLKIYRHKTNANLKYIDVGGRLQPLPTNFDPAEFEEAQKDIGRQADLKDRMTAANQLTKLTVLFDQINKATGGEVIGLSGGIKLASQILKSTAEDIPIAGPFLGKAYEGISDFFSSNPEANTIFDISEGSHADFLANVRGAGTGNEMKEDVFNQYAKEYEAVVKRAEDLDGLRRMKGMKDASDDEIKALSTMLIIESRARYLLARMNKTRDRISNADLDNAAKRTGIIKLIGSKEIIEKNYGQIYEQTLGIMKGVSREYLRVGGDPRALAKMFPNNPYIIQGLSNMGKTFQQSTRLEQTQSFALDAQKSIEDAFK
jgi:hypothetical protein